MAIEDGVIEGLTPEQSRWFGEMRRQWYKELRPFDRPTNLLHQLPNLPETALANCRLHVNRYALVDATPPGSIVAEIGTQAGEFATHILRSCQPARLHIFEQDMRYVLEHKVFDGFDNVQLHEGDSSVLIAEFADDYFDWIYIDGDHSYPGAKKDAEACKTKVKVGGKLIFNDYVSWSVAECAPYGVPRAVHELCAGGGWSISDLALHPFMHFDIALTRLA